MNIDSWKISETRVITVEGKPTEVKTLPTEIQFEIETYDRFKQEYLDLLYAQDKLRHALQSKLAHIENKIKQHLTPKDTTGDQNDTRKE